MGKPHAAAFCQKALTNRKSTEQKNHNSPPSALLVARPGHVVAPMAVIFRAEASNLFVDKF